MRDTLDPMENHGDVFQEPAHLLTTYVPPLEHIVDRREEIASLENVHNPMIFGNRPVNMLITGREGSGKTMCTKYVFRELVQDALGQGHDIGLVYVNCLKSRTLPSIVQDIVGGLNTTQSIPTPRIGETACLNRLVRAIDEAHNIVVVIFDEIEKVRDREEFQKLTNVLETDTDSQTGLLGISDESMYLQSYVDDYESELWDSVVSFPPYTRETTELIVTQRLDAFTEEGFPPSLTADVVEWTMESGGDASFAVDLLRNAGRIAVEAGHKSVTNSDLNRAVTEVRRAEINRRVDVLPDHTSLLVHALSRNATSQSDTLKSKQLFEFYSELCSKIGERTHSKRYIRELMRELERLNLVEREKHHAGRVEGVYISYYLTCDAEAARLATAPDE